MTPWWPGRIPLRLRVFFRGAFLLLALATVGLALSMLREERALSLQSQRDSFRHTLEQVVARLQHPTGQLALLNPPPEHPVAGVRALVLPFAAIDFDDRDKAQQAVEMAGCEVQFPDHARLCVAVGNSAAAGGFVYLVGQLAADTLVGHVPGARDLAAAHRLQVDVTAGGTAEHWLAPLETATVRQRRGVSGVLAAFPLDGAGRPAILPDREFRGWLWQDDACLDSGVVPAAGAGDCPHLSFFSLRVPVAAFRDALYQNPHRVWPPRDLDALQVRLRVFAPGGDAPLFDSAASRPSAPFALSDLQDDLQPGQQLEILARSADAAPRSLVRLAREEEPSTAGTRILGRLIQHLPVADDSGTLEARAVVGNRVGSYEVVLRGDTAVVDRSLARVAARLSWFVAAMLAAILLTWLAIEVRIIRRITALTVRAAEVRGSVHEHVGPIELQLDGLRGSDELGVLAGALSDLMQRINEDVRREQARLSQARDMWHAVGHEIMAPLQSLSALHEDAEDPSRRYVQRMQQAVRVLYGSAAPAEAIASADLQAGVLDLRAFLVHVAANAADAGIAQVEFDGPEAAVTVKADEYPLEDVITHVLTNADRHRVPGTDIRLVLEAGPEVARVRIRNQGRPIPPDRIERIFEYGVSEPPPGQGGAASQRGQGLFVARTYMAKMGGTITAQNLPGGVEFVLTLGRG